MFTESCQSMLLPIRAVDSSETRNVRASSTSFLLSYERLIIGGSN